MQPPDAPVPDDLVRLGEIIGVHGVRGWVKVFSDTSPRENIVGYRRWWLGDGEGWSASRLVDGKRSGRNVLALLDGVDDRDKAASLIGRQIAVSRLDLPDTEPGEFYWTDLVGCEVVSVGGVRFGTVSRLFETGANDVLVVTDERDGHAGEDAEILIPWVRDTFILAVDLDTRRVTVDWDPDY